MKQPHIRVYLIKIAVSSIKKPGNDTFPGFPRREAGAGPATSTLARQAKGSRFLCLIYPHYHVWSLSQNSVSFGKGFRKSGLKPAFSNKSKVAFPKTEVLG
ncbi:MAG: hypothetical protein LBP71_04990, partial [Spirochaetaceae bacterium]|nr:hypothetical protein [Spirochaetaceae bacterium]